MQFENWVDRQIREAMERGEFDNLPGAGKPLELDPSEDWWIKAKMARETCPRPTVVPTDDPGGRQPGATGQVAGLPCNGHEYHCPAPAPRHC